MSKNIPESKKRWDVRVKGTSYRQSVLSEICGGTCKEGYQKYCRATLLFEDHNAHDPNAVAVLIDEKHVGYLPRDYAPKYRAHFKQPRNECDAKIDGGFEDRPEIGYFGVLLDLPSAFDELE